MNDEQRLAASLLASGRLSDHQLAECLDAQRAAGGPSALPLAAVVVQRGLLTPEQLRQIGDASASATLAPGRGPPPRPGSGRLPGATPPPPRPPTGRYPTAPPSGSHPFGAPSGTPGAPSASPGPPGVGGRIGRYQISGELGRGGMGVVFRGHDPALRRDVAIKMILDRSDASRVAVERFVREARATARLRHPGIVPVHEVGDHDGRPFIVMDFIPGGTLDAILGDGPGGGERIARRRLARIVREVAVALDHAHAHAVVHRDVKPQNVLIDEQDRPHLTDFGAARDLSVEGGLTQTGQVIGTPLYMAPEQANGDVRATGPRSDVYALGVILYHGLVGEPPFQASSMLELMPKIFRDEPRPPRQQDPSIHADLETITLKCLEKDPERRYGSAAAFADDLGRYLEGEAIAARPIGRRERWRRWARKHRAAAGASAVAAVSIVALVVLGIAGGIYSLRSIRRERDDARRARDAERAERVAAEEARDRAAVAESERAIALDRTERMLAQALAEKAGHRAVEGRHAEASALAAHALSRLDGATARSVLARSLDRAGRLRWVSSVRSARVVAWSPAGDRIATGGFGLVRVWDVASGRVVGAIEGHEGAVSALAWSPDGARLASGGEDGVVRVIDPTGLRDPFELRGLRGGVLALGFDRDGKRLAAAGVEELARWDVAERTAFAGDAWEGEPLLVIEDDAARLVEPSDGEARPLGLDHRAPATAIAFDRERGRVAIGDGAGGIVVRTLDAGATPPFELPIAESAGAVTSLAWSPSGARLAVCGGDRALRIFDVGRRTSIARVDGHASWVGDLRVTPDGERVVSCSKALLVWDTATGVMLANRPFPRLDGVAGADAGRWGVSLAISPDGGRVAAVGGRNERSWVGVWDLETGERLAWSEGERQTLLTVDWSPDGRTIATAGYYPMRIRLRDPDTLEDRFEPVVLATAVGRVRFSPDGRWLAATRWHSNEANVAVIDLADRSIVAEWMHHDDEVGAAGLAWSPDGSLLATASDRVILWRIVEGRPEEAPVATLEGHTARVRGLAFDAAGERIVSASDDGTVRVWSVRRGETIDAFRAGDRPRAAAFTPDGRAIASGTAGGRVRVWDLAAPRLAWSVAPAQGANETAALAFGREGRLAIAGTGPELRIVDPRGDPEGAVLTLPARADAIAWDPSGRRLAAGLRNGEARVWSVDELEAEPTVIEAHETSARTVAWSDDGRRLATGGPDRRARIWDVATAALVHEVFDLWTHEPTPVFGPDLRHAVFVRGSGHGLYLHQLEPPGALLPMQTVFGREEYYGPITFDAAGHRLAWGGMLGEVHVWNLLTHDLVPLLGHRGWVSSVSWRPDGRELATAGVDGTVRLWDPVEGRVRRILRAHGADVRSVAWSPDETRIATASSDRTARVFDVDSGRELVVLEHETGVADVRWSPDGRLVATASGRGAVTLWDLGAILGDAAELIERVDEATRLRVRGTEVFDAAERLTPTDR